jgi:signal peptidase II
MPVFPSYPFVLISSGAIGNILDRILYGYVVDFVKIGSFYVFNVADASITIGSLLLAFMLLTEKKDKHAT